MWGNEAEGNRGSPDAERSDGDLHCKGDQAKVDMEMWVSVSDNGLGREKCRERGRKKFICRGLVEYSRRLRSK